MLTAFIESDAPNGGGIHGCTSSRLPLYQPLKYH